MDAFRAVLSCVLVAQLAGQTDSLPPAQQPGVDGALSIDAAAPVFPMSAVPAGKHEPAGPADADLPPGEASAVTEAKQPAPPELVAEMLTLPEASRLAGHSLTLFEALSPAQGQLARLEVVHAYWRLVQVAGQYRVALDESRLLDSLAETSADTPALQTARASAQAALERAELLAVTAQYDLAAAAPLPTDSPLPLPADLPHIGPYRTYFDELFSQRPAPPRVRLVDRTLPIGRRAIDLRAEAVNAAVKALEGALQTYRAGQSGVETVIDCAADRARQQRDLLVSVCQYNHDIAEYALAVISPQSAPGEVVAMLITTARDLSEASASGQAVAGAVSAVQPATLNEPVRASSPRRPTLAPPKESVPPQGAGETPVAEPREISPAAEQEMSPLPPREDAPAAESSVLERPMVPVFADPMQPSARITRRPIPEGAEGFEDASGLYPALVGKEPAVQAKQLAAMLHRIRLLPDPAGEPVTLGECLRGVPSADRRGVIEKYWLTAQKAAEYQLLVSQRNAMEELAPLVAAAEQSNRLQVARAAAEADLLEAQRKLLESQLELTRAAGRTADSAWLLPATQPHCGPYALKLDAQPRELVDSWSMRRLTATIPGLADALAQSAFAVVQTDARRAAVTDAYRVGDGSLDQVLQAIDAQTRETLSFLDLLATYNRAIARYAVAVLPATVSEDQLVGALVLE